MFRGDGRQVCQDFLPLKLALGPQTWPIFLRKAFWQVQWLQSQSSSSSIWIKIFPALCARSLTCTSRRVPISILLLLAWPFSTCLDLFGACPLWPVRCHIHLSLSVRWLKLTRITNPLVWSKIELPPSLAMGFSAAKPNHHVDGDICWLMSILPWCKIYSNELHWSLSFS